MLIGYLRVEGMRQLPDLRFAGAASNPFASQTLDTANAVQRELFVSPPTAGMR